MSNLNFDVKKDYEDMNFVEREEYICDSIKLSFWKAIIWIGIGYLLRVFPLGYVASTTILWFLLWSSIFICPIFLVKFGINVNTDNKELNSTRKELLSIIYTTIILPLCLIPIPINLVDQANIEMAGLIYSGFIIFQVIFYPQNTILFFFEGYRNLLLFFFKSYFKLLLAFFAILVITVAISVLYVSFQAAI